MTNTSQWDPTPWGAFIAAGVVTGLALSALFGWIAWGMAAAVLGGLFVLVLLAAVVVVAIEGRQDGRKGE